MRDLVIRAQAGDRDAFSEVVARLRDPDRFEAWFRRLLVRACFRRVRRTRRVTAIEIPMAAAFEPAIAGGERRVDIHDQLERGLARLPAEQRAVVILVDASARSA